MATIKLKNGTGAPLASDLVQGEPALDLTNKRLYTEDSLGAVIEVGVNPTELNVTNNIVVGGTVDGRDIATDGTKLDTVETNADVTDTANVTAAGAVMDSELTSEASVKALNQGVATTDSPTFAGIDVTGTVSADGLTVDVNSGGATATVASFKNNGGGVNTKARLDFFAASTRYAGISGGYGSSAPELSFDINGTDVLGVTSTGIDVTGTVTADGLTVDGGTTFNQGSGDSVNIFRGTDYATLKIGANATDHFYLQEFGSNDLYLARVNSSVGAYSAKFASNGDISFYEDTGTTAKLFWDSSAESLNVGSTQLNFSTVKVQTGSATDAAAGFNVFTSATGDGYLLFSDGNVGNQSYSGQVRYNHASDFMAFGTAGGVERMRIDSSGQVGIGNSSPSSFNQVGADTLVVGSGSGEQGITIYSGTSNNGVLAFADGTTTTQQYQGYIGYNHSSNFMRFFTDATERMRIDSSGNVGIGTSSPTDKLNISSITNQIGLDTGDQATYGTLGVGHFTNGAFIGTQAGSNAASNVLRFGTSGAEAMRLDSSGNLLVGKSSSSFTTAGVELAQGGTAGKVQMMRSSGALTVVNTTDDGSAISIYKGTSAVGSIGTAGGDFTVNAQSLGVLQVGGASKYGWTGSLFYPITDNASDLGTSSFRFKDLYLSGGVIAGSAVSTYKNIFDFDGASINGIFVNNTTGSGAPAHIAFSHNGAGVGSITCTASATAYNTSSDYRLKENVVPLTGAIDRVKQLKPSRFNFIVDANTTVDGFIAHEVQEVIPEAATGSKDAMRDEEYEVTPAVLDDDGNVVTEAVMGTRSVPDYQGIDQSKIVPLLVAAIQELEARLAAIESN